MTEALGTDLSVAVRSCASRLLSRLLSSAQHVCEWMVFANSHGRPLDPATIYHAHYAICDLTELRRESITRDRTV